MCIYIYIYISGLSSTKMRAAPAPHGMVSSRSGARNQSLGDTTCIKLTV